MENIEQFSILKMRTTLLSHWIKERMCINDGSNFNSIK